MSKSLAKDTIYLKFKFPYEKGKFNKKMLNKKDRNLIKKFPNKLKQNGFILSRLAKFDFRKRGKFSISHKDDLALVGLSKDKDFGLDLEILKDRNFKSVMEFCFNEDEKNLVLNSQNKKIKFYEIFTAKEAIIKAQGLKFSDLSNVGYNKTKNKFLGKYEKSYNVYHEIFMEKYIFCICFKGKKDIINLAFKENNEKKQPKN